MTVPVEVYNQKDERFQALTQSFVWTLTASLAAGMLALGLSINDRPAGLLLLLAAFAVGAIPLVRLKYRSTRHARISISDFPEEHASIMNEASRINQRLHAIARRADPGPIQDHLSVLATTANIEITNTHARLKADTGNRALVELAANPASLIDDLTDLEQAATSLLDTQRITRGQGSHESAQGSSTLSRLTDQTHEIQRQLANDHSIELPR